MESRICARTFIALTIGAAGMACLIALLPAAGHDQMWLLLSAQRVLDGAKLYGPQVFESNPPLIVWISILPAWLANLTHLPATAIGKLLVLILEAAVAVTSLKLLRRLRTRESHPLTSAQLWALAFAFVTIFAVMPARDFGQRDHILALLCLPYLLAAALRAHGDALPARFALPIGIAAGIGIALKPHQVLILVFIETGLLFLTRRRHASTPLLGPEPIAIASCGLLYLLLIHRLTPDYLTQVLPLLRDTYWAFGHLTLPGLIAESIQLHILILAVATLLSLRWSRISTLPKLLALAGLAATLAYYLQGTGWYYQQLPALSLFALALVFSLLDLARYPSPATRPLPPAPYSLLPAVASALSALALFLTAHFTGYPFTPARSFPIDTPDPSFFADLPPGTPVATLTTTVDYTVPPVFRYHLTLAQRSPHLWMLPAILRNEDPRNTGSYDVQPTTDPAATNLGAPSSTRSGRVGSMPPQQAASHSIPPARLAQLDALQHAAMVEDLIRWRPQLILVERCQDPAVHCQVLEDRHDDLLAWFLRDPAFRAQFSHYRYLRSAGAFDGWVRID